MRSLPVILVLVALAGCAEEPSMSPSPPATSPAAYPPAASMPPPPSAAAPTSAAPPPAQQGVLFERTFDFAGNRNETRLRFEVPTGTQRLAIFVDSAGPPSDGSFTSAVMDIYPPGYTSPMFAELPGEEKRQYTREMYAEGFWGEWMVRFAGEGGTSVTVRVSAA